MGSFLESSPVLLVPTSPFTSEQEIFLISHAPCLNAYGRLSASIEYTCTMSVSLASLFPFHSRDTASRTLNRFHCDRNHTHHVQTRRANCRLVAVLERRKGKPDGATALRSLCCEFVQSLPWRFHRPIFALASPSHTINPTNTSALSYSVPFTCRTTRLTFTS